jgi:cytochrome P450
MTATAVLRAAASDPVDAADGPVRRFPVSPAGPADDEPLTTPPPGYELSPAVQGLRFAARPMAFAIGGHRHFGDVWTMRMPMRPEGMTITCHPDHFASLMKSRPGDAPSLTGSSPLGAILGPDSVLTSVGDRHLRQRKLLLPPFHGEAVQRYVEMIHEVAEAEIDGWREGAEFALAPRMQAVTLEVIMRGIFGIDHSDTGSAGARMREMIRRMLALSTTKLYQLIEIRNHGRRDHRDLLVTLLGLVDRQMYAVIRARRTDADRRQGGDVLSLLLAARDEDGEPLSDKELRDELMALVLAGHETTANSLAWTFERLLRTPDAYDRLRDEVRSQDPERGARYVEATVHEGMRARPVIPMVVRMVTRPWRFGEYVIPAQSATGVSIIGMHHRSDVYSEPATFRPERFLDEKPGTYTWIPFGGGIRRCLGASLAMAEQRVMVEAIARRCDLEAPDLAPEKPRMRNVTMIPASGCRIRVGTRRPS